MLQIFLNQYRINMHYRTINVTAMKLGQNAAPGIYEKVLDLLSDSKGSLLDLGCGSGIVASLVAARYKHTFDISCSDFNRSAYHAKFPFKVANLNASALPFSDQSFDVVLLIEVIEHVEHPAWLLHEMHRILKKNGMLIMSTPNVENWQSRLHFLFRSRFFSFLECDMPKHKRMGMGHVNPLFDFQLETLTQDTFVVQDKKYNRVRIPALNHKIPTSLRLLGEVKIYKLKKI